MHTTKENDPFLSREEALSILNTPDDQLDDLIARAEKLRRKYKGNHVSIHILTNARSGNCSQDCAYCAQSCRSTADIEKYKWVSDEKLYRDNDFVNKNHLARHCIGLSGMKFTDAEIEELAAKVAELEQQMAAITAPPTEYYTSAYSGEEIDAAVKKVSEGLAGGVASFNGRTGAVLPQSGDYNATQIPVSGEPEAETVATALSNKAPGGFGFGDAIQEIATTSAEESYETYCAKVDAVLDEMPDKTAKLVRAYPPAVYGNAGTTISLLYKSDANYAVLSNIGSADAGLCGWRMFKQRYPSSSSPAVWMPFEWEHPPMRTGIEYRTTERHNNKPVYKKAVNTGALSAGTSKSVAHGVQDIGLRLSALYGLNNGGDNLVSNPGITGILVDGSNITITTAAGFSTSNSWVVIAYTKTTD